MEHTSGWEKLITPIDCLEAWCCVSESVLQILLSILQRELMLYPQTGRSPGSLLQGSAGWAEGRECRHEPAIPLHSALPEWVTGGCVSISVPPERQMCSGQAQSLSAFPGKAPTAGCWYWVKAAVCCSLAQGCILVLIPTADLQSLGDCD